MSETVLHHDPTSASVERVRLARGLEGLSRRRFVVPIALPKPDLAAPTGGDPVVGDLVGAEGRRVVIGAPIRARGRSTDIFPGRPRIWRRPDQRRSPKRRGGTR